MKPKFRSQEGVTKVGSWCRCSPRSQKHSLLLLHFLLCTQHFPSCHTHLFPAFISYVSKTTHTNIKLNERICKEIKRQKNPPHSRNSLNPPPVHWYPLSLEQQTPNRRRKPGRETYRGLKISLYCQVEKERRNPTRP